MNYHEMGQVVAYLLRYRVIESKPVHRRHFPGERDLAVVLHTADPKSIDHLQQLLAGQGFLLVAKTDTDYRGIATGEWVWMLVRHAEHNPPPHFSQAPLFLAMKIRPNETNESAGVWFLHLWLLYLSLIYTQRGRGVGEVSGYLDATFEREKFLRLVEHHIEEVRKTHDAGSAEARVAKILTDTKGQSLGRRVNAFLALMCDSALLLETAPGVYQQSLLGAVEIDQSFQRGMGVLIPDASVLEGIVNIAAQPSETDAEDNL